MKLTEAKLKQMIREMMDDDQLKDDWHTRTLENKLKALGFSDVSGSKPRTHREDYIDFNITASGKEGWAFAAYGAGDPRGGFEVTMTLENTWGVESGRETVTIPESTNYAGIQQEIIIAIPEFFIITGLKI